MTIPEIIALAQAGFNAQQIAAMATAPAAPAPAPAAAPAASNNDEIIAVIAAAVAACGCSVEDIAYVRRLPNTGWTNAARVEANTVRNQCF